MGARLRLIGAAAPLRWPELLGVADASRLRLQKAGARVLDHRAIGPSWRVGWRWTPGFLLPGFKAESEPGRVSAPEGATAGLVMWMY